MSNQEISLHFAKAAKGFAEVAEGLSGVLEILSRNANPDRPAVSPVKQVADNTLAGIETKEEPKRGRPATKNKTEVVDAAPQVVEAKAPVQKLTEKAAAAKTAEVAGFENAQPVTADKLRELCVKFAQQEGGGQEKVKATILAHSGVERLALLTSDEIRGRIFADLTKQLSDLQNGRKVSDDLDL